MINDLASIDNSAQEFLKYRMVLRLDHEYISGFVVQVGYCTPQYIYIGVQIFRDGF
jgi:hypothetical protein